MKERVLQKVMLEARCLAYIEDDEDFRRKGTLERMQQLSLMLVQFSATVRHYDEVCEAEREMEAADA
jgi:hypothetical protein